MSNPDLHIVSFAVPYPARYGGAIDVYHRIKALHREGVKIKLHCFMYGPFSPHDALKEITEEVHYYPRISWPALLAPGTPYIVASRRNPRLLDNLKTDNAPILFEAIHTTGFADALTGRKKLLRSHNIEHQYYNHLAKESQRFQYLFFQRESLALERYEDHYAASFEHVFAISTTDQSWYEKKGAQCNFLPAFHGLENADIKPGRGSYLLYQGDLSIESNQKAVMELINSPAAEKYPFVVAGKSGDKSFEEKLTKYPNLRREVDVSEDKMPDLIKDAQIVLIHSRHASGMKVKIFPALYFGRFVISNQNCLTNTCLDNEMHFYNDVSELGAMLEEFWPLPFNDECLKKRTAALGGMPGDGEKAKTIVQYL